MRTAAYKRGYVSVSMNGVSREAIDLPPLQMAITVQQIASLMPAFDISPEVQRRQTATRMEIAEAWGTASGNRILEVGCGQGDTTAVLAATALP